MSLLTPLPVAVPLLTAVVLAACSPFLRRRVIEALALTASGATTIICLLLLLRSTESPFVYWYGDWAPRTEIMPGISFVVDPFGAAIACFAAVLMTGALLYSWHYFHVVGALFHVLMLVFLAAMTGFALSGDLFNMFVFFELMGVAAYALTGYKTEESSALQGALNFAITNSIGGFLLLWGIGLLYARTGALNLALLGEVLSRRPPDGLVLVALTLVLVGFFAKSAIVPFHFWLGDAHAVAPTPVCVIFSGVMVELGLYAVARVLWTIFESPVHEQLADVRISLLVAGTITALVGGVMAFQQRHIKRMLAFSTVSHAGVFLIGIAMLAAPGLAGLLVYLFAHGLAKGSLFMSTGILRHRLGSVDAITLFAKGRVLPATAALFIVGVLALTGLPPIATYVGKALIEEEAKHLGFGWVTAVLVLASALTGGGLLRVAARVFLGWGRPEPGFGQSPESEEEESETDEARDVTPAVMFVPALVLLVAGVLLPLYPGLVPGIEAAAEHFTDRAVYAELVLDGTREPVPEAPAHAFPKASGAVYGAAGVVGAILLALLSLRHRHAPWSWMSSIGHVVSRATHALQGLHSGHPGDYVAWLTLGTAALGGAFAVALF
jgi:multicomponent Na+:H+ antiporter subunit D